MDGSATAAAGTPPPSGRRPRAPRVQRAGEIRRRSARPAFLPRVRRGSARLERTLVGRRTGGQALKVHVYPYLDLDVARAPVRRSSAAEAPRCPRATKAAPGLKSSCGTGRQGLTASRAPRSPAIGRHLPAPGAPPRRGCDDRRSTQRARDARRGAPAVDGSRHRRERAVTTGTALKSSRCRRCLASTRSASSWVTPRRTRSRRSSSICAQRPPYSDPSFDLLEDYVLGATIVGRRSSPRGALALCVALALGLLALLWFARPRDALPWDLRASAGPRRGRRSGRASGRLAREGSPSPCPGASGALVAGRRAGDVLLGHVVPDSREVYRFRPARGVTVVETAEGDEERALLSGTWLDLRVRCTYRATTARASAVPIGIRVIRCYWSCWLPVRSPRPSRRAQDARGPSRSSWTPPGRCSATTSRTIRPARQGGRDLLDERRDRLAVIRLPPRTTARPAPIRVLSSRSIQPTALRSRWSSTGGSRTTPGTTRSPHRCAPRSTTSARTRDRPVAAVPADADGFRCVQDAALRRAGLLSERWRHGGRIALRSADDGEFFDNRSHFDFLRRAEDAGEMVGRLARSTAILGSRTVQKGTLGGPASSR